MCACVCIYPSLCLCVSLCVSACFCVCVCCCVLCVCLCVPLCLCVFSLLCMLVLFSFFLFLFATSAIICVLCACNCQEDDPDSADYYSNEANSDDHNDDVRESGSPVPPSRVKFHGVSSVSQPPPPPPSSLSRRVSEPSGSPPPPSSSASSSSHPASEPNFHGKGTVTIDWSFHEQALRPFLSRAAALCDAVPADPQVQIHTWVLFVCLFFSKFLFSSLFGIM